MKSLGWSIRKYMKFTPNSRLTEQPCFLHCSASIPSLPTRHNANQWWYFHIIWLSKSMKFADVLFSCFSWSPIYTLRWSSAMSYGMSNLVHCMTSHDLEKLEKHACNAMSDTFNMLNLDLWLVPWHLIWLADTNLTCVLHVLCLFRTSSLVQALGQSVGKLMWNAPSTLSTVARAVYVL